MSRSKEFSKVNPAQEVPAIQDGDFTLAESHAIIRYLAKTRKIPDYLYPSDPKKSGLIDAYLDFHHVYTRKCSWLVFNTLFAPK